MKENESTAPAIYQLQITLTGIMPKIWRRVLVPNHLSLEELHYVIQLAMGWTNSHLHDFEFNQIRYGMLDEERPEIVDERKVRLSELDLRPGRALQYEYDFGDGWRHEVKLKAVLPPEEGAAPICVGGARACPPEDSGGPPGYMMKLEALQNPSHPERAMIDQWMGDFDPEDFDVYSVNAALGRQFKKSKGKKKRARKSA